jgi:branched-chain amino acid transport system substrate-binding protein
VEEEIAMLTVDGRSIGTRLTGVRLTVVLVASVLVAACGAPGASPSSSPGASPSSGDSASGEPLKIGALLELTGAGAFYGASAKDMLDLLLDKADQTIGGRPVEVIYEDSATDTGTAATKARKLIEQDQVDVLFGPIFSDAQLAIAPYLQEKEILDIASLGGPWELSQFGNWIIYPGTGDTACTGEGDWLYDKGYRSLNTFGADYTAGHQLVGTAATEFEAAGGTVTQQTWVPFGTQDFAPYITAFPEADAITGWTIMPDLLAFLKSYSDLDVETPLFICSSEGILTSHLAEVGPKMVGVQGLMVLYFPQLENPLNDAFKADLEARYNRAPTNADGSSYVALSILLAGLEATNGDASLDVLRPAILGMTVDTLMGEISFTTNGFAKSTRYITEVVDTGGTLDWSSEPLKTIEDVVDARDS